MFRSTALALVLAFGSVTAVPALASPAVAASPAPVTQMDHISIEKIGKGSPVFLIPGLSMSRENWRATAKRIADRHSVYLVQLNGFGGSDAGANLDPGVMDGVVADLHKFIAEHGLKGVKLVGHSLGGTLALKMAEEHGDDLSGVMLVDALPWVGLIALPPTATPAMVKPMVEKLRDQMKARYGKPVDEAAAKRMIAMLALKPKSQELAYGWSKQADVRVTAQAYYEDMMADLRPGLSRITVPMTLIYPWATAGAPKEAADRVYRSSYADVPKMTFVDVGDSGHFIMLDQPEAFNKALDTFLAS